VAILLFGKKPTSKKGRSCVVGFSVDVVDVCGMSKTDATTETIQPVVIATTESPARPLTFRLPKPGEADRFFGFSRSFYYHLEKVGQLKMLRIRDAGKERGVTLIPYEAVAAFVRSQMEQAQE